LFWGKDKGKWGGKDQKKIILGWIEKKRTGAGTGRNEVERQNKTKKSKPQRKKRKAFKGAQRENLAGLRRNLEGGGFFFLSGLGRFGGGGLLKQFHQQGAESSINNPVGGEKDTPKRILCPREKDGELWGQKKGEQSGAGWEWPVTAGTTSQTRKRKKRREGWPWPCPPERVGGKD